MKMKKEQRESEALFDRAMKLIAGEAGDNGTGQKQINLNNYELTLDYIRKHISPALTINGYIIIRNQEIMNICGLPGAGKSSILETIILAIIVNLHGLEGIDTNGIEFESSGLGACLIDTERPPDDNRVSLEHLEQMLDLENHPELRDGNRIKGLKYLMFAEEGDLDTLKAMLEEVYKDPGFKLIIIDGVLDFVSSMNDDKDSAAVVKWIRALTVKYDKVTITTLHPNKNSENMAGHLGAMIYRWCRASLLLRANKDDRSVKELVSDFDMGKLKHADMFMFPGIYWRWSTSENRMMPAEKPEPNAKYDAGFIDQIFNTWLLAAKGKKIPAKELLEQYAQLTGLTVNGVRPHITEAVKAGYLGKDGTARGTKYYQIEHDDDLPF